jgi:hypothetical protein
MAKKGDNPFAKAGAKKDGSKMDDMKKKPMGKKKK